MSSTRRGRKLAATIAGLAVVATGLTACPSPAAAEPEDSDTLVFVQFNGQDTAFVRNGVVSEADHIPVLDAVLEGDFSAAPGTDIFLHTYGGAPDGIIHVTPTGTSATSSFRPEVVNGYYPQAFVGDFDGNGLDDIFWYTSGPAGPDSIWLFQPDGSHETIWLSVTGAYLPSVIDSNGDGTDDVVWYGYGPDPDSMWIFGPDAGHTKRSVQINGRYQPLVGHFGGVPDDGDQEQVIWYDDIGPDFVWTFTATGKTSRTLPNEDGAQPVVGDIAGNDRDAVYWYRPGAATDTSTGFGDGGGPIQVPVPQVRGTYVPVVGDFDGDGHDDIAWTREGDATIWHASPTILDYRQTAVSTAATHSVPLVAHPTANLD